jgi:hypothetical protein
MHGWRDARRFMDAAEVIVRHMKRDRRLVIFELLAERLARQVKRRCCIRSVRFCRST